MIFNYFGIKDVDNDKELEKLKYLKISRKAELSEQEHKDWRKSGYPDLNKWLPAYRKGINNG